MQIMQTNEIAHFFLPVVDDIICCSCHPQHCIVPWNDGASSRQLL